MGTRQAHFCSEAVKSGIVKVVIGFLGCGSLGCGSLGCTHVRPTPLRSFVSPPRVFFVEFKAKQ